MSWKLIIIVNHMVANYLLITGRGMAPTPPPPSPDAPTASNNIICFGRALEPKQIMLFDAVGASGEGGGGSGPFLDK